MPACMLLEPQAAPIRGGSNKTLINLNRDKVKLVIADHLLFATLGACACARVCVCVCDVFVGARGGGGL